GAAIVATIAAIATAKEAAAKAAARQAKVLTPTAENYPCRFLDVADRHAHLGGSTARWATAGGRTRVSNHQAFWRRNWFALLARLLSSQTADHHGQATCYHRSLE